MNNLRFNSLKKTLAELPVKNAILDGEIVCLDEHGVSQFDQLWNRRAQPIFYAFDLLWLDDDDLRRLPLIVRKKRLHHLVSTGDAGRILYAQHVETKGKRMFEEICARDLEGIVAKRKLSIYKDDGNGWLKIKNRNYSQTEGRHELLFEQRK